MKDRVFAGRDVEEALSSAASALGLPETALRYVVLEAGSAGGRGLGPTPARVAVLLEDLSPEVPPAASEETSADPQAAIRAIVHAVAEAADVDVEIEIEESETSVLVRLGGRDEEFFFGRRGEVLRALEHLLQRSLGAALGARPLWLRCPALQGRRDAALVADARKLAEAVRADGTPRTTEPLNSYERRVVHLALNGEADLTTYSVGEGARRRVTVALASPESGA